MDWDRLLPLAGVISGMVIGWAAQARATKATIRGEALREATIEASLNSISSGIDEIRLEQKDQGRRFDTLSERVTRVEESAKQAHKRIDRWDGQVGQSD